MTGRSHQLIGLIGAVGGLCWLIEPRYAPATLAGFLVANHFGSLIPDIDSGAADIWDHLPAGQLASRAADTVLNHRRFTHSFLGVAVIGLALWWLIGLMPDYWGLNEPLIFGGMLTGYLLHLLADMITVQGVPLLWPWRRSFGLPPKPLEGVRIVSGGWFEQIVLFSILNLVLVILVWTNWPTLSVWLFTGR